MPFLIFVSIVWGFSFVLIKGTLVSLDSNFVSFARLLLSFLAFLPFVRFAGISHSDRLRLLLIGGVQFGLMYVAYVAAYQYLPAYVIALMTTTTPLFITIVNDIYAKRIHRAFFFAALLAVAGGAVIELPKQPLAASLRGIVLVQLSNAAFAFGQLAYKRWMDTKPALKDANVFGYLYGGAAVVAGAFSLATTHYSRLSLQNNQILALLYLGIFASGLCFFLWNVGARKVNEGILAVMNNLKIPIGVIASLLMLGETTGYARLLIGCALFAAALWANRLKRLSNDS
jgi:drug/metabolite transporter (DMT)-like permease